MKRYRYTETEVLRRLKKQVAKAPDQRTAAKTLGLTPQTLSDALTKGNLWPRVLRALGLKRVTLYEEE